MRRRAHAPCLLRRSLGASRIPPNCIVLAVLLPLFLGTAVARAAMPPMPVMRHELANGLRILLAPDDSLPDVTVCVRYDVGSADDPDGLEGLAHLVEHLYFQGSLHVAPHEHYRLLGRAGGTNMNGWTSADATTYVETVPPDVLELALWLEADRMGSTPVRIDGDLVSHEQAITGHEYYLRVLGPELTPAGVIVSNEVFPAWHPYHVPLDGLNRIENAGLNDVRAFLRTWYTPSNALLVVAGHFDPAATLGWIRRYFDLLPRASAPARPVLPAVWRVGDVRMNVTSRVTQRFVIAAWRSPPWRDPGDGELDLAARLLAGPQGLLVRKLVETGLAITVGARQTSLQRASAFSVSVQVQDDVSVEPVRAAIEAAIAQLGAGTDESDVARARKWWTDRQVSRFETSLGRAAWLSGAGGGSDAWELGRYDGIDSARVAQAVRQWLIPVGRCTAVVYPPKGRFPYGVSAVVDERERRLP